MEAWRTAIVDARDGEIRIRGNDVTSLMTERTFTDTVFLLHRARLPADQERAMLDAILSAVADHGSGAPSCAAARLAISGNRASVSAAVAAGILTIGDEHGGAGSGCMEMIAAGVERARRESLTFEECASRIVGEHRAIGKRVAGFGHRVHTDDPRTPVLFDLAARNGLAGDGIRLIKAMHAAVSAQVKPMTINVDGSMAAVLYDMGFQPVFARLLFIIGRVAGLTAEVMEELDRERPMRIRVPVVYDGEGGSTPSESE
ncbi:MAG TPA: citryl-CoA lyase [Vicinamibacterales bacterium]|nr:citryl-CoA lyase [Vicinamibacterales bacterium]